MLQGGHVGLSTLVRTKCVGAVCWNLQTVQGDKISEPPGDTVLGDAPGPMSETSPVDSRKCVVATNDSMDVLTEALSNCKEQLRLAEQQLDERCAAEGSTQRGTIPESRWTDQFTSAMCCSPPPSEILEVGTRSLPSKTVASPCRNDVPFKVAGEKHLHVCVVLTSTGVCNGAVLFCQPILSTAITSASPVLLSCVADTFQYPQFFSGSHGSGCRNNN